MTSNPSLSRFDVDFNDLNDDVIDVSRFDAVVMWHPIEAGQTVHLEDSAGYFCDGVVVAVVGDVISVRLCWDTWDTATRRASHNLTWRPTQ